MQHLDNRSTNDTTNTYFSQYFASLLWKSVKPIRTRVTLTALKVCTEIIFTRPWLRYVRVFANANPSVCLSVCRLSVPFVHPTQEGEPFGNISSPLCTLAILWPPCKILRRSSQGKPSVGGVKRKRGIKIERFRTYRRLYLTNGTR